jgi:hypothetical protein
VPIFSHCTVLFLLACIGRPEASISLSDQQRDFFNEKKMEVEAARRFVVVSDKKNEVGNENQEENAEEARLLDVESEWRVEEMDGNKEKQANSEKARLDVQNEMEEEMDDDVSRKDIFYDTEEANDKVVRSTAGLLLFIVVIVGFVMTWYARKVQRKRSGLHKKLDVAAPYMPVGTELRYGWDKNEC